MQGCVGVVLGDDTRKRHDLNTNTTKFARDGGDIHNIVTGDDKVHVDVMGKGKGKVLGQAEIVVFCFEGGLLIVRANVDTEHSVSGWVEVETTTGPASIRDSEKRVLSVVKFCLCLDPIIAWVSVKVGTKDDRTCIVRGGGGEES